MTSQSTIYIEASSCNRNVLRTKDTSSWSEVHEFKFVIISDDGYGCEEEDGIPTK